MQRFFTRVQISAVAMTCILSWISSAGAQENPAAPKPLAPGVLNVVEPQLDARDSYSLPLKLPGLNANEYQPNYIPVQETLYGQTRKIVLFRDVWNYEFAFLPLRQIEVSGKAVWYMIYRIRDTGKTLSYEQVKEDPRFDHLKFDLRRNEKEVAVTQFLPRFSLEGWASGPDGELQRVVYRDQVSPKMVQLIQFREDPNRHLLNAYEMSQTKIPVSNDATDPGVWGIAVWENIDPTIDYVSVFVSGLTNAYRLTPSVDEKIGFIYKTLQLNFWRPGDTAEEVKDDIDYGIPLVDNPKEQVEICRRYQLPGPVFRAYRIDPNANQNVYVWEADAAVSLQTFGSTLVAELKEGKIPESLVESFANSGIEVASDATVVTDVKDSKWLLKDAAGTEYVISLEPQFWEPTFGGGIRFIKSLDHFWIYR